MPEVLVVDADRDVAEVVCAALEAGGYDVSCAWTPAEASSALIALRPDGAVIDAILASVSGLRVACHAIDLGIPVLIMTAEPMLGQQLTAVGCRHLVKPFNLARLLADTQAALNDAPHKLDRMRDQLHHLIVRQHVSQQMDLLAQARRNRRRAEECRVLSEQVQHPRAQASYQHLARTYDAMAMRLEEIANGPAPHAR